MSYLHRQPLTASATLLNVAARSIEFVPDQAHAIGTIAVGFEVTNLAGITAEHPFLAFSALGLSLAPGGGWRQEQVTTPTGTKLVRFCCREYLPLQPAGVASPCKLLLDLSLRGGGALIMRHGMARSLWDPTDLRIACRVGAANFAPESVTVTVPGNRLSSVARAALDSFQRAGTSGRVGAI